MEKQEIAELVNPCPPINEDALTSKIRAEVGLREYLFYRTGVDDDTSGYLQAIKPFWEMECTACGTTFAQDKVRKAPPARLKCCPKCGAATAPRRWNDRAILDEDQFSYQLFQRGAGRGMWLRSFQVRRTRDIDTPLHFEEYQRILYIDHAAYRWTRITNWYWGIGPWKQMKAVKRKRWHGQMGQTRDDIMGGVEIETVKGSCLEYSQLPMAMKYKIADLPAYLALYVKYPACEYLWKMGFGGLMDAWETDKRSFNKCVNLKADRPDKLLKGLNRAEIKLFLKFTEVRAEHLITYRTLRDMGVCRADWESVCYAQTLATLNGGNIRVATQIYDIAQIANNAGVSPATLRRWHEKQAGRSGHLLKDVLRDHLDYMRQLNQIGAEGGSLLPHDLHESHTRLSRRLRTAEESPLNRAFRTRRHLLRWLSWRHDGLFIRVVDSPAEITREGENQDNCVAGYAKEHARGETTVLVLRKQDSPRGSWYTVELDLHTLTVEQCRGYNNKDRTPEDRVRVDAFITAWLEHLETAHNLTKGAA